MGAPLDRAARAFVFSTHLRAPAAPWLLREPQMSKLRELLLAAKAAGGKALVFSTRCCRVTGQRRFPRPLCEQYGDDRMSLFLSMHAVVYALLPRP